MIVITAVLSACDLQPKIVSLPDTVGEFISTRYPALLADPETQPEIYNSAATDYGVYASPTLYGSVESADYVEYASVDDYIIPPAKEGAEMYGSIPVTAADYGEEIISESGTDSEYLYVPVYGGGTKIVRSTAEITVQPGDTLYSIAKKYNTTVDKIAGENNLVQPFTLSIGQKLKVPRESKIQITQEQSNKNRMVAKSTNTTTRVELKEIVVKSGDTLYSLSRQYSVPVNDLAVMNKLSAPFTLSVGQKLKVPNLGSAPVKTSIESTQIKTEQVKTSNVKTTSSPKPKISSDPKKKLPTISARSSSKFSWPVKGKVLSSYGSKSNGLFNDGINIAASRGTTVKAAENGVVAYAGNEVKGMGNLIIIQHSGGWMTVYAHLDSMSVRRGTKVLVGQKIGTVGETGKVDQPQLHFEIRKGTKAYNPSSYLKK